MEWGQTFVDQVVDLCTILGLREQSSCGRQELQT
jgi:hypothetical protein